METPLQDMELRVSAVRLDQLFVGAVLDEPAGLDRDDAVGGPHRRQSVRYDENGPARCDLPHVLLYGPLALVVECAGRLVEDEYPRIGDERAGYRDALALAAGQARTTLADDGVVAFGKADDEVVSAGERGCRDHALHRHHRVGERDVVADGPVEEHVLLKHHADLPP